MRNSKNSRITGICREIFCQNIPPHVAKIYKEEAHLHQSDLFVTFLKYNYGIRPCLAGEKGKDFENGDEAKWTALQEKPIL